MNVDSLHKMNKFQTWVKGGGGRDGKKNNIETHERCAVREDWMYACEDSYIVVNIFPDKVGGGWVVGSGHFAPCLFCENYR